MSLSVIFAFAVVIFLSLVSLVIFLIWHSYRQEGMLGGLLLMWTLITIFIGIVYFNEKKAAQAAKEDSSQSLPASPKLGA